MPELRVGDFLSRRKEVVHIEDGQDYRQVTISLNHGGVRLRGVKPGAEIGTKRQYLTRAGDFILSRIDARNAAFGIVPDSLDGAVITNDFWSFEIDRDQVDLDYFYLLSQTDAFLDACVRSSTGTTNRQRIQAEFFLDYVFEVPPLADQARAVERYQSMRGPLDTITEALDRQAADLDALRQRVLDDAVRGRLTERDPDDEPAEVLLARVAEEKRRRYEAGEIRKPKTLPPVGEDERPFGVPEGWVWTRVGEVMSDGPTNGSSPKAVKHETSVRSLTLSATSSGRFDPDHFKYLDLDLEPDADLWLQPGDILVQRGNSPEFVGIAALFPGPANSFVYPDLMMRFRVPEPISASYTVLLLQAPSSRRFMLERASGTSSSMPKINQQTLRLVPFALPPPKEQRRIVARVDALLALCDRLADRLAAARADAERLVQTVLADALAA